MTQELIQYMDERFGRLETAALIGAKNILTLEEAAVYTGYSARGVYTLTSQKRIPHYKKNGRLYFAKRELDEWMTGNRVRTAAETDSAASAYVAAKRNKAMGKAVRPRITK